MLLSERMLMAHGGRDLWKANPSFSAYASIGGKLIPPSPLTSGEPAHAGANGHDRSPARRRPAFPELALEGDTQRPLLRIFGATDAAVHSVYTPGRCSLRTCDGDDVEGRDQPFASLSVWPSHEDRSLLALTAVIGAILWNTIVGPFVLTLGGKATQGSATTGFGEAGRLSELRIDLPEAIDPLTPERRLFINEQGLIERADYALRVIGHRHVVETMGAYGDFGGIRIPTLRRIALVGDDGQIDRSPLVDIEIFDVRFF